MSSHLPSPWKNFSKLTFQVFFKTFIVPFPSREGEDLQWADQNGIQCIILHFWTYLWNSICVSIYLTVSVTYVTSLHWSIMFAVLIFQLTTSSIIHKHLINGGWSILHIFCSQISTKCFFFTSTKSPSWCKTSCLVLTSLKVMKKFYLT